VTTNGPDYREQLKQELEARTLRNPKYSLRAFARDLGLSPSRLSHVLSGHFGLSKIAAETVAQKLGLSNDEQRYFCDLVESAHARSPVKKKLAKQRVKARLTAVTPMSADAFAAVSAWYHFAIMECLDLPPSELSVESIAKSLDIKAEQVKTALERLVRLGLVKKEGRNFKKTKLLFANPEGIPSESVKRFHEQMLEKAVVALRVYPVEKRDFSNLVVSVAQSDLPELKRRIKSFRQEIDDLLTTTSKKDSVYNLSIQLFPLTK
jgi:uncharacterized protein (TIGR02147 family)